VKSEDNSWSGRILAILMVCSECCGQICITLNGSIVIYRCGLLGQHYQVNTYLFGEMYAADYFSQRTESYSRTWANV
jgi:hypothetical protein